MSAPQIRLFTRADRDQPTDLVNAHVAAVVPGLARYGAGDTVGDGFRGAGEIRRLLFWPQAPFWPDSVAPAGTLAMACLAQFARWRVRRCLADGTLSAPGVYGVPEQWPRVRDVGGAAHPRRERHPHHRGCR